MSSHENLTEVQRMIEKECADIAEMLIAKNKAYGSSFSNPIRVFSKAAALEQINVRIDDKLSRIARGSSYGNEDTEADLIGYLILKRVALRLMPSTIEEK